MPESFDKPAVDMPVTETKRSGERIAKSLVNVATFTLGKPVTRSNALSTIGPKEVAVESEGINFKASAMSCLRLRFFREGS